MKSATSTQVIFRLCRGDKWERVLEAVKAKPDRALTPLIMDNNITTTIIHQAITSRGNVKLRALVIETILEQTPLAASIRNGYGSLPIHVIAQRNTKMERPYKESLIVRLVEAYPAALSNPGGLGKRTPLHIIFTDYISASTTGMILDLAREACFMKDKKGFLPLHVACSRHCSPEKLAMLLDANPSALYDKTNAGETPLSLAQSTATPSHPNNVLIDAIRHHMTKIKPPAEVVQKEAEPPSTGVPQCSVRERDDHQPSSMMHMPFSANQVDHEPWGEGCYIGQQMVRVTHERPYNHIATASSTLAVKPMTMPAAASPVGSVHRPVENLPGLSASTMPAAARGLTSLRSNASSGSDSVFNSDCRRASPPADNWSIPVAHTTGTGQNLSGWHNDQLIRSTIPATVPTYALTSAEYPNLPQAPEKDNRSKRNKTSHDESVELLLNFSRGAASSPQQQQQQKRCPQIHAGLVAQV